jgi:hypothetical protein
MIRFTRGTQGLALLASSTSLSLDTPIQQDVSWEAVRDRPHGVVIGMKLEPAESTSKKETRSWQFLTRN